MKLSNFIVILCIVDDVGVVAQSPEPGAHVKKRLINIMNCK